MVKDAKRFPDSPGHLGCFSFGHKAPPYLAKAVVALLSQCSTCHVRLASKTDFVVVQAHIGMARPEP